VRYFSTSISKYYRESRQSELPVLLLLHVSAARLTSKNNFFLPPFRFDVYCEQVRMEYAFVPLPTYLEKRAQFLLSVAAAPRIYNSAEFQPLEAAARRNCSNEAARLLQLLQQCALPPLSSPTSEKSPAPPSPPSSPSPPSIPLKRTLSKAPKP